MSKVFVNIGLSLDGYMTPEGMTLEHWDTPEYKNWGAKWGALMGWVMKLQYFRENLKFGPGGETGPINDGPERALELARESAGSRDVRISGGADVIQQYLNLGVVDELEIALAPVLFGGGRRLFENLREPAPQFRIDKGVDSPAATHLRYVRQ